MAVGRRDPRIATWTAEIAKQQGNVKEAQGVKEFMRKKLMEAKKAIKVLEKQIQTKDKEITPPKTTKEKQCPHEEVSEDESLSNSTSSSD